MDSRIPAVLESVGYYLHAIAVPVESHHHRYTIGRYRYTVGRLMLGMSF